MQYVFSDKIANLRPSAIREILKDKVTDFIEKQQEKKNSDVAD